MTTYMIELRTEVKDPNLIASVTPNDEPDLAGAILNLVMGNAARSPGVTVIAGGIHQVPDEEPF